MIVQNNNISRLTALAIFISIACHAFFGFHLDYSVDEAHYALYGLHLDWSYFDHPPLVGWIQALPIYLHFSEGFIRLFLPELLWCLCIFLCMAITRLILENYFYFSSDAHYKYAPYWTALCIISSPLLHVLSVGLLPDTLLFVIVPAMMWVLIKLHIELNQRYPKDFWLWIGLGILLGLAALSKYTSIFFAIVIPICLINWHGLRFIQRPGLWLSLLLAAILTLPIIYWNKNHEWISFTYQFAHGTGGDWQVKRLGTFLANQFLCFGVLGLLGVTWTYRRHLNTPTSLLLFFFIPFCIFLYFSGGGSSLPHWTSPAWIALAPIAGIGLANAWGSGKKFWISFFLFLQLMLCALGFTLLFTAGLPSISMKDDLGKKNPIADLYGWKEVGEKVSVIAKKLQVEHLAVQNWTLGSRLAWYARPLPVHILDERTDQFDLWFGKMPIGANALVLNWSQMSFINPVSETGFKSCEKVDTFVVRQLGRDISQFDLLLCQDWQGSFVGQRNEFDFNIPMNDIPMNLPGTIEDKIQPSSNHQETSPNNKNITGSTQS